MLRACHLDRNCRSWAFIVGRDAQPRVSAAVDDGTYEAFSKLDERAQRVLYLRYWCDLPYLDIAARLALREEYCGQLAKRALVRMGRELRWDALTTAADERPLACSQDGDPLFLVTPTSDQPVAGWSPLPCQLSPPWAGSAGSHPGGRLLHRSRKRRQLLLIRPARHRATG